MPIQVFLDDKMWCVGFPPDVSSPPVCIDTSSSDLTVTIPDHPPSSPPLQVVIGGDGDQVTIPPDPPFQLPSGTDLTVEFPSGGTITFPRGPTGTAGGGIRVKGGKIVVHRPFTAVPLKVN